MTNAKVEGDLFVAVEKLTTLLDGITADRDVLLKAVVAIKEMANDNISGADEDRGHDTRWSHVIDACDAALRKCQHG